MAAREFCYWLQGFFEVMKAGLPPGTAPAPLTAEQIAVVRNHLDMVFLHEIDPSLGPPEHQAKLDAAHAGEGPQHPAASVDPGLTKEQVIELIVQHTPRATSFSGETRLKC